jgi:hypothetical protein
MPLYMSLIKMLNIGMLCMLALDCYKSFNFWFAKDYSNTILMLAWKYWKMFTINSMRVECCIIFFIWKCVF